MQRIITVCEGQTEQSFCGKVLSPHFIERGFHLQWPTIKHTKGGLVKWSLLKKQIETHLLSDPAAYVTTLIDYYGLYRKYEFPRWDESEGIVDKNSRMIAIENAMKEDIQYEVRNRFIPYIQLHEFEGLLFNDIDIFHAQIPPDDLVGIDELERTFREFDNPEMINNNPDTAPSKRLYRIIKGYNKIVYGDILAEAIGLPKMREKCPRFTSWINTLEQLEDI
jgi:hypothetical protein